MDEGYGIYSVAMFHKKPRKTGGFRVFLFVKTD